MSETNVNITFEGKHLSAIEGQSIASVLVAHGFRITRYTRFAESPRGIFCGIGSCFDCLVVVDGAPNQRACITEVREGMTVQMQTGVSM